MVDGSTWSVFLVLAEVKHPSPPAKTNLDESFGARMDFILGCSSHFAVLAEFSLEAWEARVK